MIVNTFTPNWVSIPGNTISDILTERKIPISHFAADMRESADNIQMLLDGRVAITEEMSHKLENVLGVSYEFWLVRELQYQENLKRINAEEQSWLKKLPIQDLVRFGWVKEELIKSAKAMLEYFGVSSVAAWNRKYETELSKVAFRTSSAFTAQFGAVATWLRQGEIQGNSIRCSDWNPDLFRAMLPKIKSLTRVKEPRDFIPKLIDICSQCGVAIAIAPTPKGCPASGLTRFLSPNKALLMLSFRYLRDDNFWFTFFHEAGHLLLHGSNVFVEEISKDRVESQIEDEANEFAAQTLIPLEFYDELLMLPVNNKRAVLKFAAKVGVSAGIVIGQLQHIGRVDHGRCNFYKKKYTWEEINYRSTH